MIDGSLDFSKRYRSANKTRFQDIQDGDILSVRWGYPTFVVRARRNVARLSFSDLRTALPEEFLTRLILGSENVRYKIGFSTKLFGHHDYLEILSENKPANRYPLLNVEEYLDGRFILVSYPHVLDEKDVKGIEGALKENKARVRNYLNQSDASDKRD